MRLPSLLLATTLLAGCGHSPAFGVSARAGALQAKDEPVADIGKAVQQLPKETSQALTFMTYKALDNSLDDMAPIHLNILEKAGSNANVNMLALVDREAVGDTREYFIQKDANSQVVTSPFIGVGELDTGNPASLAQAVNWAATQYPARFRWVDVNSHGGGYQGVCIDETSNSRIELPQLPGALGVAGKIDLLSFDACLMASVEVAYELRNVARVMVASEDESFALGMNYDKTLEGPPATDPAALGRELVLNAARFGADPTKLPNFVPTADNSTSIADIATISAIDLSKLDAVAQAVDGLAGALSSALPRERSAIMLSLNAVKPFSVSHPVNGDFDHRDLHEAVVQLAERVDDPGVQAACKAVTATLFNGGGAIVMSRAVHAEQKVPRGLSIYLPLGVKLDPRYAATSFAKQTRWAQFLAAINPS